MSVLTPPELNFKFSKKSRLLKRKEFMRVSYKGRRYFGRYLLLEGCTSYHKGPRLGITVSKRYGPSVQRNLFKRHIREVFRLSRCHFPCYVDFLVKPRKMAREADFELLTQEFERLVTQWSSDEKGC